MARMVETMDYMIERDRAAKELDAAKRDWREDKGNQHLKNRVGYWYSRMIEMDSRWGKSLADELLGTDSLRKYEEKKAGRNAKENSRENLAQLSGGKGRYKMRFPNGKVKRANNAYLLWLDNVADELLEQLV